jgi:hypothetical protein
VRSLNELSLSNGSVIPCQWSIVFGFMAKSRVGLDVQINNHSCYATSKTDNGQWITDNLGDI